MIDVLFVDKQVILAAAALMPNAMAVMNKNTSHRTAPTRFLHQEHHATKIYVYSRHQYTHNQRDRSCSYNGPRHRRHFSSPTTVSTMTEASVLEDTLTLLFKPPILDPSFLVLFVGSRSLPVTNCDALTQILKLL